MKKIERKRSLTTSKNMNKQAKNISTLINNFQSLQSERANKSSHSERNQENIKFQLIFLENLIDYSKSLTNKSLCLILSNKLNKIYLKTPNIYTNNNNNNNPINNNNNNDNNIQNNNTNNSNNINNINNNINIFNNNNKENDFYNIYKHFTLILVSLLFMSKFEILYKNSSNKVQTYLVEFIIFSLFNINKISSQKIINFLLEFEGIHLPKNLNLSEITKNFSSSIFKINESYINIEKCINDLILNINNLSLSKLISLINESILFCMDSNINVNIEIENNNNNNNNNNINQPEIIKTPYITTKMQKNFCLVLDLDETITHNTPTNYFLVRPGTINFLTEISKYYEIIIFTSAHQNYADNILNRLDPEKKFISFRFYKQHTYVEENKIVKNIKNLGRDLKKIIFIDNIKYVAKYSMENIYQIKTWIDDVFDNELDRIKNKLIEIAKNKKYLKDVRKAIKELI